MALGAIPVMHGMPPYGLWEQPDVVGRIPPHRTDVGAFLTAEVFGARRCILVKDERGLSTADPKKEPQAEFIAEISVSDLLAMDLADLAVERSMLEAMQRARSVTEILLVNGRQQGDLTRALNGEIPAHVFFAKDPRRSSPTRGIYVVVGRCEAPTNNYVIQFFG